MKIKLLRHYKVDHKWKLLYSSHEFAEASKNYDNSPVISKNTKEFVNLKIYTSSLRRAIDTALDRFPNNSVKPTELLNEIPVSPFIQTKLKLPVFIWFIIGRLHWTFSIKSQVENREKTGTRINALLDLLENEGEDCILVGHGFYFLELGRILRQRKYSCKKINRLLRNGEHIEYVK